MEPLLLAIDAIYGVILSVAAVLAALQSQRDLTIARSLIKFGAILMAVRWGAWAITTDVNWITRGMVGALIGATLFVLVPAAVHWITVRVSHDGSDVCGTIILTCGVAAIFLGRGDLEPIAIAGSLIVLGDMLLFAYLVFRYERSIMGEAGT